MQTTGQAIQTYELPPLPLGVAVASGGLLGALLVAVIWAKALQVRANHRPQASRQSGALKRLNLSLSEEIKNPVPFESVHWPAVPPAAGEGDLNAQVTSGSVVLKPTGAIAITGSLEQRKHQLWQRLRAEAPWLLQLIERTPLLIWGPQRSGKSTLAKVIAILRTLFVGHAIEVADPQAQRNRWPGCFVVHGAHRNYAAIGDRLIAYYARIARQQTTPTTSIWDEFTSYEGWVDGEYKPYAAGFVKSVLSESQAANEFAILLAHGRTQGYLGGSKGTKEAREKGLVEIEAIPAFTDTGKAYPSGRYIIANFRQDEMNRLQDKPVTLPVWLSGEALLTALPELDRQETAASEEPDPDNLQAWQRFIDEASPEQIDKLIARHRTGKPRQIPEEWQAILTFAAGRDWVSPSEIQAGVRTLRKVPAEVLQAWFYDLENHGLGVTKVENGTCKFCRLPDGPDSHENLP